jgi:CBS domain-containing protein/anti-sigma regulatory factor (Ser/Thr protein kinase)
MGAPTAKQAASASRADEAVTDGAAGVITRVEELSYELKIAQVMTPNPHTATPDMRMGDLLDVLRRARISGLPVVGRAGLVGVVSLEDLVRAMSRLDLNAAVADYMTREVITVKDTDPVVEALQLFTRTRVGRLPVVAGQAAPDGPGAEAVSGSLVGILTKGDITRGLLRALQSDYQAEEVRRYRASHLFQDIESSRTSLILRYTIKAHDFEHGGYASSCLKRALLRLGAAPQIARRCGIAVYEAEMNLVIHATNGGFIRVEIEPHRILVKVVDDGPGIPDIERALKPGYSTASEAVRELGFGAGMGLPNIQRCVDKLAIESAPGKGTRLEMKLYLPPADSLRESNHPALQDQLHDTSRRD